MIFSRIDVCGRCILSVGGGGEGVLVVPPPSFRSATRVLCCVWSEVFRPDSLWISLAGKFSANERFSIYDLRLRFTMTITITVCLLIESTFTIADYDLLIINTIVHLKI